jgi:methylenetetrahydrofolate dehydrogenase (NADP+)/methenyltetrahydrofolate cyclohydrolase
VPPLAETRDRIQRLSVSRYQSIKPIYELAPELPRRLINFVSRALELNPERRFGSPSEMLDESKRMRVKLEAGDTGDAETTETTTARSPAEKPSSDMEGHSKTVLVIESKVQMQDVLRDKLKKHGYRVLVFSDPGRAIGRFQEGEPPPADCVLFCTSELGDYAVESFNQFGSSPITRSIPAILFVDQHHGELIKEASLAHHRVVLTMPMKMRELRETLLKLLRPGYQRSSTALPTAAELRCRLLAGSLCLPRIPPWPYNAGAQIELHARGQRVSAKLLEGKSLATRIEAELAEEIADFIQNNGVAPGLTTVLVGDDPASSVYVRNKHQACERVGIEGKSRRLPATTSEEELLELVAELNSDEEVHGILVQLPLPTHIRPARVLDAVHPMKDVDCFHPENVGCLWQGRPRFLPCTPHGCLQILHRNGLSVAGKHVVIVGRSDIVGKPLAALLVAKDSHLGKQMANATVTLCHSQTHDLAAVTRQADVLVAAIGQPRFIGADMVKPGAVVIDVGINRTETGLCGDVDFEKVAEVAGYLTPVPRGVGPLTVTMLMRNTLTAARLLID